MSKEIELDEYGFPPKGTELDCPYCGCPFVAGYDNYDCATIAVNQKIMENYNESANWEYSYI